MLTHSLVSFGVAAHWPACFCICGCGITHEWTHPNPTARGTTPGATANRRCSRWPPAAVACSQENCSSSTACTACCLRGRPPDRCTHLVCLHKRVVDIVPQHTGAEGRCVTCMSALIDHRAQLNRVGCIAASPGVQRTAGLPPGVDHPARQCEYCMQEAFHC